MIANLIRRTGLYALGVCLLLWGVTQYLERMIPHSGVAPPPAQVTPPAFRALSPRGTPGLQVAQVPEGVQLPPRRASIHAEPGPGAALVVYAAASLTESFQELERVFRARPDGCALLLNFGGSSWLRTQIEQGAYADVFASANEPQMDRLVRGNRVEPPCTFAENRLTLLIPRSNPGGIETLGDLARPGVRLLLAHSTVPIGYYAEKVLEKLPEVLPLPDGYTQDTLANVVSRETTVKQVVAKVALGEADAGFVYVSDLRPQLTSRVRSLDVPEAANQRARYPVAVLRESRHPELARAFLDFLLSQPGQEILAGFRFLPVAP